MQYQKPKGTEDYFPDDMEARNAVFASLSSTARKYGFREVSSPAFESISLLTKKEGEEIKGQIFTLEKKGSEEFGLRFDLTVPLTRMFIEQQKVLQKPVKWFALDRMWRYEQPQKGRLREFYQLSIELFGSEGLTADAEVISLAIDCLKDLGLTEKDFVLRLNSRKLLQPLLLEMIKESQLEAAMRIIDKRSKISEQQFLEELKKEKLPKEINDLIKKGLTDINPSSPMVKSEIENISKVLELLGDKKKFIKFDLSVCRGLAYYTGIVFEVTDREGKFRAILGGGRYDNLVETFGGQKTPATGFGLGYATLMLLLKERDLLPEKDEGVDFYIAPISEKEVEESLKVASRLRKRYSVDIDMMGRNLSNQMKYANNIKAKNVIVIGEDELKSGNLTIKDMKSGKERKSRLEDI